MAIIEIETLQPIFLGRAEIPHRIGQVSWPTIGLIRRIAIPFTIT